MAAKKSLITTFTPPGRLAFAYIAKPDTTAPEGARFQPDCKYKGTICFDGNTDLSKFEALVRKAAADEFGKDHDDLALPFKAGKEGGEMDSMMVMQAKTIKQPECVDAKGRALPGGVFPKSGDKVVFKIALVPYEKTEKVREKGKMVDVMIRGVSARLYGVQVIERGAAASAGGWAVMDGYDGADEPAIQGSTGPQSDDDADLPF